MKQLVLLSLKYIRRQKLRSFLTFICIMLSVFIVCSVAAYSSSIMTTLTNKCKMDEGSWEADLGGVFENYDGIPKPMKKIENVSEAVDTIAKHNVVDDMYFEENYWIYPKAENDTISYFEVAFDDNGCEYPYNVHLRANYGDHKLDPDASPVNYKLSGENGVNCGIFPNWLRTKYGYNIGDEITLRFTFISGRCDPDLPDVKKFIEEVRENNKKPPSDEKRFDMFGSPIYYNSSRPLILDCFTDDEIAELSETGVFTYSQLSTEYFTRQKGKKLVLEDEGCSEPVTLKMKIADFDDREENLYLLINSSLMGSELEKIYAASRVSGGFDTSGWVRSLVRINDKYDFDDGIEKLMSDLGLDTRYKTNYGIKYNDRLLSYELKGADAITDLLGLIIIGILLLVVTWFFVRFIIDNAFEVSVKERSTQFAALRVMGASKGQLIALVFTEAFFYSVTAVPIGIISAVLLCKYTFDSFRDGGLVYFGFSIMPFFAIIGVVLSIAAIFISALTSALWASRRLSPAEALSFGKPQSGKKKRRRTKLDMTSRSFSWKYTMRNVFGQKGRLVMVVLTNALGIALFTAALLTVAYTASGRYDMGEEDYDYFVRTSSFEDIDLYKNTIAKSRNFEKCTAHISMLRLFDENNDSDNKEVRCKLQKGAEDFSGFIVRSVERSEYEEKMQSIMGMTYDEFADTKSAVLCVSAYADDKLQIQVEDPNDKNLTVYREEGFVSAADCGFDSLPHLKFRDSSKNLDILGTVTFKSFDHIILVMPLESAAEYFSTGGVTEEQYPYVYFDMIVGNPANSNAAYEEFEQFRLNCSGDIYYDDRYSYNTGLTALYKALVFILITFILSFCIAGVCSTISVVNTSVLNRSRELTMIRAVGMSKKDAVRSVIMESVTYSGIAAVVGVIIGLELYGAIESLIGGMVQDIYGAILREPAMAAFIVLGTIVLNLLVAVFSSLPSIRTLKDTLT